MIDRPIIIGCGTVGSTLSIGLAKSKLVNSLDIYDFDIVSYSEDNASYPFLCNESGIPKIKIIEFYCKYLNPDLKIRGFQQKIEQPFDDSYFVIDCRDCKSTNINAKIRISLDGYMLYIDSLTNQDCVDYHYYITPKNPKYIELATEKIIQYLKKEQYLYTDFRLYNLESDEVHVLKREDFYGFSSKKRHSELSILKRES